MWEFAPLTVLTLVLTAVPVHGAHPNNSIAPRVPPPTPHGLTLIRSDTLTDSAIVLEPESMNAPRQAHRQLVRLAEDKAGPYSVELAELLTSAGLALQQGARHREAIEYFQRALHLSRVNIGLYSTEQVPILDALIDSQRALGLLELVDGNLKYRFRLHRQIYQPGDSALLEATVQYGEWQRLAYLDGFGGDTYMRLLTIHEIHSREAERIDEVAEGDVAQIAHLKLRMQAEYLMSQYDGEEPPAFQASSGNAATGTGSQSLHTNLDLERFRVLKKHNYRNGRHALARVIELLEKAEPLDTEALARAKIAQGDWFMWWAQASRALGCYEQAYEILAASETQSSFARDVFEQPVELPAEPIFEPGQRHSREILRAKATAKFDVSRLGRARSIEILKLEPVDSMGAKLAILRLLQKSTFRPRLEDGEAVLTESVVREYNFEYNRIAE